jgi:cobalamin biosynthesis Mg chelatase CobN
MIPLTLRAMHGMRRHPSRSSAQPVFALLSVLALLAFACFPVLAQAEESSGTQYETAVPTVTGHTTPPKGGGTSAHTSNTPNGGTTGGGTSGSESSGGPSSGTNPSTAGSGGTGQSNPGNGSTGTHPQGNAGLSNGSQVGGSGQQTSADDSSSPLVPILIAIAALAAISIAVVVIRQRRQRRSPGAQVSPKAS